MSSETQTSAPQVDPTVRAPSDLSAEMFHNLFGVSFIPNEDSTIEAFMDVRLGSRSQKISRVLQLGKAKEWWNNIMALENLNLERDQILEQWYAQDTQEYDKQRIETEAHEAHMREQRDDT